MNIQRFFKNTAIACVLFAGLTISSESFGQIRKGGNGKVFLEAGGEMFFSSRGQKSTQNKLDRSFVFSTFEGNQSGNQSRDLLSFYPDGRVLIGRIPVLGKNPNTSLEVRGKITGKSLNAQEGTFQSLTAEQLIVNKDVMVTNNLKSKSVNAQAGIFTGLTVNFQNINNDLSVKGSISAKRVSLAVGTFPDYVFEPSYKLKPLEEVEAYIKKHHHLPNVPAAQKVIKGGLDVGQMNILLMEKVEELTLHAIAQNKQIKQLLKEVKTLKAAVKSKK